MAQANICDRCGTVYRARRDVKESRYHVFDTEKERYTYSCQLWNGEKIGDVLDLCDACTAELAVWIEGSE